MTNPSIYILRSCPGVGKSYYILHTLTPELNALYGANEWVIASADHYFIGYDGVYRFDANKLGQAHGQCRMKVEMALAEGKSVVVDNTNTTTREYSDYVTMAKKRGYDILVVEIVPLEEDLELYARRNAHGVPLEAIRRMFDRWQPTPLELNCRKVTAFKG